MSGEHQLCSQVQPTIVGHRGGFASHVRSHWAWAIPLPDRLNFADAGPLLCGGITVFNPLARFAKPTSRVGIVGIGGLGHMGVKFAAAYGCEVGLTEVLCKPKNSSSSIPAIGRLVVNVCIDTVDHQLLTLQHRVVRPHIRPKQQQERCEGSGDDGRWAGHECASSANV
jgi:hypothetical protein